MNQQQHGSQYDDTGAPATHYTAPMQNQQPSWRGDMPPKNRLILAGGLVLTSLLLTTSLIFRQIVGVTFLIAPFLFMAFLFYALYSLKKRGKVSETKVITWLGIALLVVGFCMMMGMLSALIVHWLGR